MRPSAHLLLALGLAIGLALLIAIARLFEFEDLLSPLRVSYWILVVALGVAAAVDALSRSHLRGVSARREISGNLAAGASTKVVIQIANQGERFLRISVSDYVPDELEAQGLPHSVVVEPAATVNVEYRVVAIKRGMARFGPVELRVLSKLGLWEHRIQSGEPTQVRIYPNFVPIIKHAGLSFEQQINRMGLHVVQQRGEGMDFHQLREFREGDVLRQVDWKASARYRKPISREYQSERDQDVIFLLDCGRRMRAKEDHLSHFDLSLNAMLLTSYIALRQGDAVGFSGFAGPQRWVPPAKGQGQINHLLNSVYDLHSSTQASDFLEAATQLVARCRKRSLVILISNAREDDVDDLQEAIRLLRKHHIVILASLRENFLEQRDVALANFEQALEYSGTLAYLRQRQTTLQKIKAIGLPVVDSTPDKLHIGLVNQYLLMKRSGQI